MNFYCLDSSVLVKLLVTEEDSHRAHALLQTALVGDLPVIAPTFAWTEVGSILRKKVRQGLISNEEAQAAWEDFVSLPLRFENSTEIMERSWDIAGEQGLPTLYDAAFLATVEMSPRGWGEFWTADRVLLRKLEDKKSYVRDLSTFDVEPE